MSHGHTIEEARTAKRKALQLLEDQGLVAGVGITRTSNGFGLKINLPQPADASSQLPEEIDGVPIRVEVVGPVTKR